MSRDRRVEEILGEWRVATERGVAASPEDLVRQHPDLADELREAFAVRNALDGILGAAKAASRPPPAQVDTFRILRELGRGGMGTVYLAEGPEDSVALKLIHPHLTEREGFLERFRREGELGRRVDDENVVRTLGVGSTTSGEENVHFLVMEFVEGRTLRALLSELDVVPEALAREIALQAASGLVAIHAAGIVHRDLKPENLLITQDHRVRIMDLGVARVTQRSTEITRDGQFAGSLHYAAPEQFRTKEIGPAADLYSLGVLLYELTTGENPFRSDAPAEVMSAHLDMVPPRADVQTPELSAFFAEILATLLEKHPDRRFRSATELRDVLMAGEKCEWWRRREGRGLLRAGHIPRVPVRRQTPLYGRERELTLLRDAWRDASEGRGNCVLLEGEAGIGKSRLVDAFLEEIGDADVLVLYGSYPPWGGLGGLSDSLLHHFGTEEPEERLRPYLSAAPSLLPALATQLRQGPPPDGSLPLTGDALHAAYCHLLRGLAKEKPLLWILEDLHFAEPDGLRLMLSLARAVDSHRVLLLLTTRPGLPAEDMAHFGRVPDFRRKTLSRLGARDVILLLKDVFRSVALAEKLGGKIALKSDGVPFFVFEMIRGLKEGQFITQLPDGSYVESRVIDEIDVPSAVKDLIEVRLSDLTPDERNLLDVAAVQGFTFDPGLLAEVLRRRRVEVLQELARIERTSGIVRARGRHCCFDHHQIQEVVYAMLSESLREEYHTLLARALATRHADADPIDGGLAWQLATHGLQGSEPAAAVPFLDPALDHLEQAYRNDAVLGLVDAALRTEGLVDDRRRVELLLRRSGRLEFLGPPEAERAALHEARVLAEDIGDVDLTARVQKRLGWHLHRVAEYAAAQEALTLAVEEAAAAGNGELAADAVADLGSVAEALGQPDQARKHFEESLEMARRHGYRRSEGIARKRLGFLALRAGHYPESREHFEYALAIARETGDRTLESASIGNVGLALDYEGRLEEARDHYERQLALAREIGHRESEANAANNLGVMYLNQELGERAREHFQLRLALAREIGDLVGEANGLGNLGSTYVVEGRWAEAVDLYREALVRHHQTGNRPSAAIFSENLGYVLRQLGRSEEARESLEDSVRLAREVGDPWLEGNALHRLGVLETCEGNLDRAKELLRRALDLRKKLEGSSDAANTLLALGDAVLRNGESEEARGLLEEAIAAGRDMQDAVVIVLAAAHLARLPGGDRARAEAAFEENGADLPVPERMEACHLSWLVTKEFTHLDEAHRLLCHLRDHAPEEFRTSMIERVALHREILAAWEAHRGAT